MPAPRIGFLVCALLLLVGLSWVFFDDSSESAVTPSDDGGIAATDPAETAASLSAVDSGVVEAEPSTGAERPGAAIPPPSATPGREAARVPMFGVVLSEAGTAVPEGLVIALRCKEELRQELEQNAGVTIETLFYLTTPYLGGDVVDGKFSIAEYDEEWEELHAELEPDEYFLIVQCPGFNPESRFVSLPSDEPIAFRLKKGSRAEIRCVDSEGQPLPGIYVLLANRNTGAYYAMDWRERLSEKDYCQTRPTNEHGVAAFDPVPIDRELVVSIWDPEERFAGVMMTDFYAPIDRTFVLVPMATLQFRITDPSGSPIADVGGLATICGPDGAKAFHNFASSDEAGNVTISGLPSDSTVVAVSFRKDGHSIGRFMTTDLLGDQGEVHPVLMQEAFAVSGTVRLSDGTPLSGATLSLKRDGVPWLPGDYTVDEDGAFETNAILTDNANYAVTVNHQGYLWRSCPLPALSASAPVDLVLPPAAWIDAVEVGGERVQEGHLLLVGHNTREQPGLYGETPREPSSIALADLPVPIEAGDYQITLDQGEGKREARFTLHPDARTTLTFAGGSGTLAFTLPQAVEGEHTYHLVSPSLFGGTRGSSAGGLVELPTAFGDWSLKISFADGSRTRCGPFKLESSRHDLGELRPGGLGSIAGQVRNAEGEGVPGIWVVADRRDGWRFPEAMSGPDGAFHLDALPAGRYRVSIDPRCSMTGREQFPEQVIDLESGQALAGMELTLGGGLELVGRVVSSGPEPIWLLDLPGDSSQFHARADATGNFRIAGRRQGPRLVVAHAAAGPLLRLAETRVTLAENRAEPIALRLPSQAEPLPIENARGEAVPGARIEYLPEGLDVGIGAQADGRGLLRLAAEDLGGRFRITAPGYAMQELPAASLTAAGRCMLRAAEVWTVEVVDVAGRPIPGASVSDAAQRHYAATDAEGLARLADQSPAGAAELRVSAAGYWTTCRGERSGANCRVTLRSRNTRLVLELPGEGELMRGNGPYTLMLEPRFDLGYPIPLDLPAPDTIVEAWKNGESLTLAGWPEGDYDIWLADMQGVVAATAANLRGAQPVEASFRQ